MTARMTVYLVESWQNSFSRNVLISIHQRRILLADLDAVGHVTHSFPFEEAKLPEYESDDHYDQEAPHDGDHHDPDGDIGNASF